MSDDHTDKVLDVINNFLEPNLHLLGMQRVHRRVFDEQKDFTRWDQVREYYTEEIDWSDDKIESFVIRSKQIVEDNVERIPETYFNIIEPENIDEGLVKNTLENVAYDPDEPGDHEGFQYNVQNGMIHGRYIYSNINTDLDFSGDIRHFAQEHSVRFRINPEKDLLIIENTGVVAVQKARSAFNRKTNFGITVCGSLTMTPSEAPEKMDAFLDSFSEDRDRHEEEPVKYNTDKVKLHNPEASGSGDIKKIDLDGDDIAGHELIEEQIEEDDYIIKGLTTRVNYKNEFFNVTVMAGGRMAYAKVEDVGDLELGKELMSDIQERYMEHFREY